MLSNSLKCCPLKSTSVQAFTSKLRAALLLPTRIVTNLAASATRFMVLNIGPVSRKDTLHGSTTANVLGVFVVLV
jgi:hypothetical protein